MARQVASYGLDRWLLALAFLAGAGGTVALKIAGAPPWIPASFAGGTILGYAVAVWFLKSARLEPEQIGDNAYYLGFVLTLCSLAYTLWSLGTVGVETAFVAEVVAGFGVALTSTVVGVAVRVFLMQFRIDLVARERETQMAVSDAAAAFRSEIADAIRGTRYLGAEIRQTLAQHHHDLVEAEAARNAAGAERLARAFEAAAAAFTDWTGEAAAEMARRSVSVVAEAAARLDALDARMDEAAQARAASVETRLDDASARAVDAAEARLAQAIARFETAANRSTAALGRAALSEARGTRSADLPAIERPRILDGGR